ncbi:MAG: hypothetical protein ABIL11_15365 [Chloroflexota bacterium]
MWHDHESLFRLIDRHFRWYPFMEPRDVYKLLYQGAMGPEHLIASEAAFRERLLAEFAPLEARQGERLYEPVRPDGSLVRINLRPFKFQQGDLDWLVAACLAAGQQRWGRLEELRQAWETFLGLCQEGRWPEFDLADVSSFSAWLEVQGYPAVHHSTAYRSRYEPSYRLILKIALGALPPNCLTHNPRQDILTE